MIEALNKDVPYDRFVKLQLAADLMKDATRDDCARWATWAPRRSITKTGASRPRSSAAS